MVGIYSSKLAELFLKGYKNISLRFEVEQVQLHGTGLEQLLFTPRV
jgi:hypothetical protein